MNELRSISVFTKAAEFGSLRRAAAELEIAPQAASLALLQLEQRLGVRLFHRTTRNIALTDEGRQFLEAVKPALTTMQRALQMTSQSKDENTGPLRIVGPRSSVPAILGPILEAFRQHYPNIQPDVQLDDQLGNWVEDRVDVGFRMGRSPAEGLIARRLLPLQLIICAAPAYLSRHGTPKSLNELASHQCSTFRHPTTGHVLPWFVKVGDQPVAHDVVAALSTNDEVFETNAVLSGQVISQLSGVSAAPHIRSGRLIPLLTTHVADHLSIYMYYGTRTAQPARVRAFINFAVDKVTLSMSDYVLSDSELSAAEAEGLRDLG